jgi:hypothetical protein
VGVEALDTRSYLKSDHFKGGGSAAQRSVILETARHRANGRKGDASGETPYLLFIRLLAAAHSNCCASSSMIQGKADFFTGYCRALAFRNISRPPPEAIAWALLHVLDQKKSSYR